MKIFSLDPSLYPDQYTDQLHPKVATSPKCNSGGIGVLTLHVIISNGGWTWTTICHKKCTQLQAAVVFVYSLLLPLTLIRSSPFGTSSLQWTIIDTSLPYICFNTTTCATLAFHPVIAYNMLNGLLLDANLPASVDLSIPTTLLLVLIMLKRRETLTFCQLPWLNVDTSLPLKDEIMQVLAQQQYLCPRCILPVGYKEWFIVKGKVRSGVLLDFWMTIGTFESEKENCKIPFAAMIHWKHFHSVFHLDTKELEWLFK